MVRQFKYLDEISKICVMGLLVTGLVGLGTAFYALLWAEYFFAFMFASLCPICVFVLSLHMYAVTEPKERKNAR